jgi:hypothetical protein
MFSKKIKEEKSKNVLNKDNDIHISSFRYVKVHRDNHIAIEKAEKEFFPFNGGFHTLPKADAQGTYHQEHQFTFEATEWHFYVEIRFDTGKHRPNYQSFGETFGEGSIREISINGIELLEFLNRYKSTSTIETISNIESFIVDKNAVMPEVHKEKGFLSRIFGR